MEVHQLIIKMKSLFEIIMEEIEKSNCLEMKQLLPFFEKRMNELTNEFNHSQIKTETHGN